MLEAERRKVLDIRSTGTIPHEVIEDVLVALDVEESMLDARSNERMDEAEVRDADTVSGVTGTISACGHLEASPRDVASQVEGVCEDCVAEGWTAWVHLRKCLECGHMGCCDSSPRRHASAHFEHVGHPVMRSAEPGEDWRWCYKHHLTA
jgi:monovalent cation/hydrogen antiporter